VCLCFVEKLKITRFKKKLQVFLRHINNSFQRGRKVPEVISNKEQGRSAFDINLSDVLVIRIFFLTNFKLQTFLCK
jgi:hypothetical protein